MSAAAIAAVVIGRNEGERLIRCLQSLRGQVQQLIYVDSGSTDGSAAAARDMGAEVVALDLSQPFTAARARNAGLAVLETGIEFVQFVDGDCEVNPDWIATAADFMQANPKAAVACGRRRERFPEMSVYNRLCDAEWDTPVGEAKACGGDALMRVAAVYTAGGYRDGLIAGEEPELCLRLRRAGWQVWRLDAEMTLHDAQMLRFTQWWNRSRRAGHAFAEGAALHGAGPDRHWVAETRRALLWGAILPAAIVMAGLLRPALLLAALIYPAQVLRLSRRMGFEQALFSVLGKFAEAAGALEFYWRRWRGSARGILEYK
ncbi:MULTISPECIES: glycosyltransferase [unclassified Leisingera]|uniref:glycosyltransferase n=1 Tax=unclassified Leisingera TaxID=2614906 RepID=UPI0003148778|nr:MULTISPECIES: glycosyltransferase family 2 protein [unclassified Leisingera]KIC23324.1 glycosyl transferase [Leisingera sp. ANG-S3]KIC49361.1 glycosyl transferase [Leisingera sp. ANG-S]KID08524.1 glycosyl transferase [Leisingera sp. ANG1]